MSTEFMQRVEQRYAAAQASGALECVRLDRVVIEAEGLPFVVQWPAAMATENETDKPSSDASEGSKQVHEPRQFAKTDESGGDDDDSGGPESSPFLPPDPELTVGPVGEHHVALLNKFPVCARHLVLARTEFQEQQTGVGLDDFRAIATLLSAEGGLAFYNGGPVAGASQRHKHLQWVPDGDSPASLRIYTEVFNDELDDLTLVEHPGLPVQHCFVRVRAGAGIPVDEAVASMHNAYTLALNHLGLRTDSRGFVPPFNTQVEDGWMLLVPRRQEKFQDISINALSYAGVLHVQRPDQVELIRQTGPLAVLAATGYA